jgi:hypothetical protein
MNIVKGVADLLRKSAPAAPGGAGGSGGGRGGGGDRGSPSADRVATAPSPRVRFRYAIQPAPTESGSFAGGECGMLV